MIDQETMEVAFAMVTSPRNSLQLYTDARVENPSHQRLHPSFNGLFPSNHVPHEGETWIDIQEIGPDLFMLRGGSTDDQHFDAPY